MDIQQLSNQNKQQAIKPLQELYESDSDLVQQLVVVINSLFSPLTWILEETLYRRIKKQDKGWIDMDYLNRNPKIINIFKDNGITFQTRRKHNLLIRAIKRSILKNKKSLIKRKVHLNVNREMKKVIYFEQKTLTIPTQTNQNQMQVQPQSGQFSIPLTQMNLKSRLKIVIKQITQNKTQNQIHEQQIQMSPSKGRVSCELDANNIEFYGTFWSDFKQKKIDLSAAHFNQEQKLSKEQQYRWCFVYLPQIPLQIAEQIQKKLKQTFAGQNCKQKTCNTNDFSGYTVQTYSLKEMVENFCPKYDGICKEIGYVKKDQHQEWLKMKNKQKQKQKIRLLESVDLDKKIDVQNQYHVKLQIEKLRKGYLKNKQAEYERKMRLRELKKSNKPQFKLQDTEFKKDTFTQKLKSILGLKNQETQKQVPQASEKLQNQREKNQNEEKDVVKSQQLQIQQEVSKIQIKLPKYVDNQDQEIYVDRINGQNEVYESFFEQQEEYQSSQSSSEEYEVPKKKPSKKIQSKKKKIIKRHEKGESKSSIKATGIQSQEQKSKNFNTYSQKSSKTISNTTYNLRHKTHSQGSYLKMVETIEDGANSMPTQKTKNDKFSKKFQNIIDEYHQINSSRSLRSRKRQK